MPGPTQARGVRRRCSSARGIAWDEAAFVGDDLADLMVLRRVGLPIAVANAVAEVKAVGGLRDPRRRRPRRGARSRRGAAASPRGMGRDPRALLHGAGRPVSPDIRRCPGAGPPGAGARGGRRGRRGRSPGRAVRPGGRAAGRCARAGDRLGRGQVGADRAEARGHAHVDRHAPRPTCTRWTRSTATSASSARSDAAIVLSKSGESEELFGLAGSLQRLGVPIVAITGDMDSTLARVAAVALDGSVAEEACPFDLAPTTSTTVALAIGDALAIALLEEKGSRREDFAAVHPGGSIGRKLTASRAGRDGRTRSTPLARGDDARRGGGPGARARARHGGGGGAATGCV